MRGFVEVTSESGHVDITDIWTFCDVFVGGDFLSFCVRLNDLAERPRSNLMLLLFMSVLDMLNLFS